MKFLSVSCFGFICLTLAHVLYLPVTGYPLTTPPGGDTSLPADYGLDWMHGTEGNNPYGFTCPEGWTMHSTQCLLFVPEKMTWEEAKKNCDSKGDGSFAAVYSDTQADEIHQEMKNAGHHDGHVWVGGSKASGDSSWSWGDYSVFDGFAKFCRGESAHHENNCLQISFDGSGSGCLDDQQCDVKLPSICGIILY